MTTDHIAQATTYLATADDHAASAEAARDAEQHSLAGRYRERERLALKRAEILAAIAHAEALDDLADAAQRLALSR